jgi:glycerophosphoryl diester phosphodiesterase
VEIQAHRANSPHTIRSLVSSSPSSLEIDVGVLGDGAVVVSHEVRATAGECRRSPLLGTPWRALSASQARELGRLTLDQALGRAHGVPVVVEAKSFAPHTVSSREFVDALEPYLPRISLASFDERLLAHARRRRTLQTTILFEEPLRAATAARTLGPRADLVTRDLVEAGHRLGMRIVPWTVNDPRHMRALADLGVDGIVTDQPALLRDVLSLATTPLRRAA